MLSSVMTMTQNIQLRMMTYVTHALVQNALHFATKMTQAKAFEGRLKHYPKKNQKFELLGITLLVLNGVGDAQVEFIDLSEFGIWRTEETLIMANPMSMEHGEARNGFLRHFDCEVSCAIPNPVGVEVLPWTAYISVGW